MATEETELNAAAEVPAAAVTMTPEQASALEREIVLNGGNPDYLMPDGRTNREIWEVQAEQDEKDREEAEAYRLRSLEANTPRAALVEMRVEPNGLIVTSPAPAVAGGEGDIPTVEEPAREIPGTSPDVKPLPTQPAPSEPTAPTGPTAPLPGVEDSGALSTSSLSSPTARTPRRKPPE